MAKAKASASKHRELTPKERRFVAEYLIDQNATQAATRAGYTAKRLDQAGYELLRKPEIQAQVEIGQAKQLAAAGVTVQRIVDELAKISFADRRKLFDSEGHLLPPAQWPDDLAACVSGLEMESATIEGPDGPRIVAYPSKVRLVDKKGTLELLGRHLKMFVDRIEHGGEVKGAMVIYMPENHRG